MDMDISIISKLTQKETKAVNDVYESIVLITQCHDWILLQENKVRESGDWLANEIWAMSHDLTDGGKYRYSIGTFVYRIHLNKSGVSTIRVHIVFEDATHSTEKTLRVSTC